MEQMKKVLPKYTLITCPDCELPIATSRRDLESGDVIKSEDFDFHIEGHLPKTPMECPACRAQYMTAGELHTSEGWK